MASSKQVRIASLLKQGIIELKKVGIEEARTDATLLLGHCLHRSRTSLYLAGDEAVSEEKAAVYFSMLKRRSKREPVAYIIGFREFWSLEFKVTPEVLIPRPETEFLLDMVFSRSTKQQPSSLCLDLCCGSGVIAVVLARELHRDVVAIDSSLPALSIARDNSARHGVEDKLFFLCSDLFNGLNEKKRYGLIVTNPPYVRSSDIAFHLEPEVACYEPKGALDGGEDGLEVVGRIAKRLPDFLAAGGDFFMEIGSDQGDAVKALFYQFGGLTLYQIISVYKDYAARDRVLHIKAKSR